MWEQTPAAEAYAQFICAVKRRSGRFESIASGVVTQETTLEDSMRNDTACPIQSLSPSVSPAGNGCRKDSNWLLERTAY